MYQSVDKSKKSKNESHPKKTPYLTDKGAEINPNELEAVSDDEPEDPMPDGYIRHSRPPTEYKL